MKYILLILLFSCNKEVEHEAQRPTAITFSGKIFLQGAYENGMMHKKLNQQALLPINSPLP